MKPNLKELFDRHRIDKETALFTFDQFCAAVSDLVPKCEQEKAELLSRLEDKASEHIKSGGLRFYGVHWKDITEIFAEFGVHQKLPF